MAALELRLVIGFESGPKERLTRELITLGVQRAIARRPGVPEPAGEQLVRLIAARAARCVALVSR